MPIQTHFERKQLLYILCSMLEAILVPDEHSAPFSLFGNSLTVKRVFCYLLKWPVYLWLNLCTSYWRNLKSFPCLQYCPLIQMVLLQTKPVASWKPHLCSCRWRSWVRLYFVSLLAAHIWADRQVFGLTREYLGEVVKSVKKMGIYFKGFEGHVEYPIKGSMCRFERKFLQLKPEGAFASSFTAALSHSLQLGL